MEQERLTYFIVAVVVASILEAYRNYRLIKSGVDPHNIHTYVGRAAGLILMAAVIPGTWRNFWINLISSAVLFWPVFDTSLNLLRRKKVWYLGSHRVDKFQLENGGAFTWFVWKWILFIGAVGTILQAELLRT